MHACVCVSAFFWLLVFSNTAHQSGEITTQMASLQQYLDYKSGNFPEIESYGVQSKQRSLNEQEHTWTELSRVCIFLKDQSTRRMNQEPNDPNLSVFSQEATERPGLRLALPGLLQQSRADVIG